jgi:hypothetical protein
MILGVVFFLSLFYNHYWYGTANLKIGNVGRISLTSCMLNIKLNIGTVMD